MPSLKPLALALGLSLVSVSSFADQSTLNALKAANVQLTTEQEAAVADAQCNGADCSAVEGAVAAIVAENSANPEAVKAIVKASSEVLSTESVQQVVAQAAATVAKTSPAAAANLVVSASNALPAADAAQVVAAAAVAVAQSSSNEAAAAIVQAVVQAAPETSESVVAAVSTAAQATLPQEQAAALESSSQVAVVQATLAQPTAANGTETGVQGEGDIVQAQPLPNDGTLAPAPAQDAPAPVAEAPAPAPTTVVAMATPTVPTPTIGGGGATASPN